MDKLSNMSYKELTDLEKLIRAEKEKRNTLVYKSELGVLKKLQDMYNEKLLEKLSEYEVHHYLNKIRSNIFQICDFATDNYTIKSTTKGNIKCNKVYHNTSHLAANVDTEMYQNLVNDIFEVLKKYNKSETEV